MYVCCFFPSVGSSSSNPDQDGHGHPFVERQEREIVGAADDEKMKKGAS
jgi:hypothetical protein